MTVSFVMPKTGPIHLMLIGFAAGRQMEVLKINVIT